MDSDLRRVGNLDVEGIEGIEGIDGNPARNSYSKFSLSISKLLLGFIYISLVAGIMICFELYFFVFVIAPTETETIKNFVKENNIYKINRDKYSDSPIDINQQSDQYLNKYFIGPTFC